MTPIRASELGALELCPGKHQLEEGLPEEDSELSKHCTLLHTYMSHPEYDRRVLSPRDQDLLRAATELEQHVIELVTETECIPEDARYFDVREEELNNGLFFGHPDLVRTYVGQCAICIDYKFGFNATTPAEINIQLRSYAVLIDQRKTYVAIVQPRRPFEERLTIARYLEPDLTQSTAQIRSIIEQASKPDAPRRAGEEQCRFCRAKLVCPEFREVFGEVTGPFEVDDPAKVSLTKKEQQAEEVLAQLSDEQLEKILMALSFADFIKEPAKDEARKRLGERELPSYYLGRPMEVRKIANIRRAVALLSLAHVLKKEELLELAELPIGRIEELYRQQNKCSAKEARERVNAVLGVTVETQTYAPRILRKKRNAHVRDT